MERKLKPKLVCLREKNCWAFCLSMKGNKVVFNEFFVEKLVHSFICSKSENILVALIFGTRQRFCDALEVVTCGEFDFEKRGWKYWSPKYFWKAINLRKMFPYVANIFQGKFFCNESCLVLMRIGRTSRAWARKKVLSFFNYELISFVIQPCPFQLYTMEILLP